MKHRQRHSSHVAAIALIGALTLGCNAFAQPVTKTPAVKASTAAQGKSRSAATASDADVEGIKKALEDKFPGATISGITKSPYAGLFEVQFDDQLVYTDPKVTYVFVGSVFDASSKRNLTEEKLRRLTRVSWDTLPLDLAMKKVKGNGQRKIAVFADADCPFCARLENELKNVDNVTIYTFVYPIDQLHPDAARKTRMIWCAPDRVAAWDAWFANKTLPDNKGDCDTPLDKTLELGQRLKVNATPTLVFADGSMIPGALPAQRLEAEIKQAEAEAAKLASGAKAAQKPAAGAAKPTAVN